MAYYTRYKISLPDVDLENSLLEDLKTEIENYAPYEFEINKDKYINREESITWYEWEVHIKKASLKFPNLLILVEGEGEENGDIWRCYIKNGKSVILNAIITFPEFKEEMLE